MNKLPELVREGTKIVLPSGMPIKDGIQWLQALAVEQERKIAVFSPMAGVFPLDALIAFNKAMADIYGWANAVPTPGMFGDKPPAIISVESGDGETTQVAWGRFNLPGVSGYLETQIDFSASPPHLMICGETQQKHAEEVQKIVEKAKDILRTHSVYKGKALRVSFAWKRNDIGFNIMQDAPKFLNLAHITDQSLIFADDVRRSVELGLFAPIERAADCRKYGIPLKRGVLLEGTYGTGKSLTALVTAQKAVAAGWTFVYLDSILDLADGLKFASQYGPAVVFVEDIDKAFASRSIAANEVLNLLDGIDTKNHEIITVFTTNFVEKLDKALLRPGRLDTVVSIKAPDAKAASRLVELYGRDLLVLGFDFETAGHALAGLTPAIIREIVERAKLAALTRVHNGGSLVHQVTADDIVAMAKLVENHIRLTQEAPVEKPRSFHVEIPIHRYGNGEVPPEKLLVEDSEKIDYRKLTYGNVKAR